MCVGVLPRFTSVRLLLSTSSSSVTRIEGSTAKRSVKPNVVTVMPSGAVPSTVARRGGTVRVADCPLRMGSGGMERPGRLTGMLPERGHRVSAVVSERKSDGVELEVGDQSTDGKCPTRNVPSAVLPKNPRPAMPAATLPMSPWSVWHASLMPAFDSSASFFLRFFSVFRVKLLGHDALRCWGGCRWLAASGILGRR